MAHLKQTGPKVPGAANPTRYVKTYQYDEEQPWARRAQAISSARVRLTNVENVITFHYSFDGGKTCVLHDTRMEVSGIHHNMFGGFLSLQVGVWAQALCG